MTKFKIFGPNKLKGEIKISGSKNSALPILFASLLVDEDIKLKNIPNIKDIHITLKLFKKMGVKIIKNKSLIINSKNIKNISFPKKLIQKIRASIWLISPILIKFKKIIMYNPGGCKIGKRPINLHLYGLKKLGASINIKNNFIIIKNKKKTLSSNNIKFPQISVGATLTIILASILIPGTTIIENYAKEPEILDTINFLNTLGAKISYKENNFIKILGVKKLHGGTYKIIPDRIETGTYLIACIISKGEITCYNTDANLLKIVLHKLKYTGAKIKIGNNFININMCNKRPKAINIETSPYPNFPTDLQPQLTTLNVLAKGKSIITENIFKNRISHVKELIKMGAKIKINNNKILCQGTKKIFGTEVNAKDLRSAASLIIAGCVAYGITIINNINYIYRGYENIEKKFNNLGIKIHKIKGK